MEPRFLGAGTLFFWRDRTREVDFILDIGGRRCRTPCASNGFPLSAGFRAMPPAELTH